MMQSEHLALVMPSAAAATGYPIVWLASYPKSGNTWFRVFLANYVADAPEPVSINALNSTAGAVRSIASARRLFSDALGVDAGDFTHDEYDALRPDAYRALARTAAETPFLKVHDANIATMTGEPLIPVDATRQAIYLVRNPLDVALSFANHLGQSVDAAIDHMANPAFAFCAAVRGLPNQLRQRLLSWSGHVESWSNADGFPVHIMRYEDMLARPREAFGAAVRALGLPEDAARVERAVNFSRFDELRRQEEEAPEGFREAPSEVEYFFHRGRAGGWREALSAQQVRRVIDVHEAVMHRFGYVDASGNPNH